MYKFKLFVLLCICMNGCFGSKILIVQPFHGKSHSFIVQNVAMVLADKGHDLTVITTNVLDDAPKNYRQIQIDRNPMFDNVSTNDFYGLTDVTSFSQLFDTWKLSMQSVKFMHNTTAMKDFIKNDDTKFDLIIAEMFYNEAFYLFAHKYKAPLVLISTTTFCFQLADFMGNPPSLSYALHDLHKYENHDTYTAMIINGLLYTFERIGKKFYYLPKVNQIAKENFKGLGDDLPAIEDIERSVSLVMLNTHFSYDQIIPTIPGIIQIGGIHIKEPKPIPKQIQSFMDEAKHGVIYFALGSHIHSHGLSPDRINAFLNVFKAIPQKVIWKWENDDPPKSENILTAKWLPQAEILAHPNVKLFISHGGMLGIQEAINGGVPILGIPAFSDQYSNIAKLIRKKVAIRLNYRDINEVTLFRAINQTINDPDYLENAKKLSVRFKDRLVDPKDEIAYWVEYVIRHNGSEFLKTPMAYMSFWEYYFVEIVCILFLNLSAFCIYLLLCKCMKKKSGHQASGKKIKSN